MEEMIAQAYYILQGLRKLQNDVGHEADVDQHNLRMGIRHLTAFYNELIQAAIENQVKARTSREREVQAKDVVREKRRKKESEEAINAALKIMKM